MHKLKAIEILGGTVSAAAEAMGVSYQAIDKWPDDLPPRIAERVLGVIAKKRYPELAEEASLPPASQADEAKA
jgi:hypothetical protein